MGLLSRINNSQAQAKSFSSFQEWARYNNFAHCGLFTLVHGMMVITHSYGLDSQTIANSVSSKDFWTGTFPDNTILNYSKSDNELYNFLQFFSFELKSLICHISLIKISTEKGFSVLMVYNTDQDSPLNITSSVVNSLKYDLPECDFSKISLSASKFYLYSITFEELVKKSIHFIQIPEANITNAVVKCISEEILDLIKRAFPSPCLVSLDSGNKIKIALTNKISDENLMINHIFLILKQFFSNQAHLPVLNSFPSVDNLESLISFMEK